MSTKGRGGEAVFSAFLKVLLEQSLSSQYVVHTGKSLLYKLEVDVSGELRPKDIANPTRGQFAFETDILIEKKNPAIPLVVVELKFGGFSTHDIITYSAKATRHKENYPYLRYGFLVGGTEALSKKFLTHNQGVDFAMALLDLEGKRADVLDLLQRQLRSAEKLVEVMRNTRVSFTRYEKNVEIYD